MLNIAVLGSTRGTDLQAVIDAIEDGKLKVSIACVISNKKDAYILERAKNHNIKAIFLDPKGKTREEYDDGIMRLLEKYQADLVLLIGYMKILSKKFVDEWANKTMNVHPSLLPKFGGGMDKDVHRAVLDAEEKESGMTIHFITEEADSGPIIIQKKCKIDENETVDTLKAKVQKLEGEGFIEAIKLYDEGKIKVEGDKVVIME